MLNVDHNPVETQDGVWTKYKGTELLIAHVSCMAFQRKLARLQQPYAKQIEQRRLSPDLQQEIMCEAMAGTILKDWRGAKNGKGEDVPFTAELGKKVLQNQYDVREFVTEFAGILDNFRQEEAKDLGNAS